MDGFVTASLTVCVGAMAVVGAIQDGMEGDYSILAAKAILDFLIILIMTASLGKGCLFRGCTCGNFSRLAHRFGPFYKTLYDCSGIVQFIAGWFHYDFLRRCHCYGIIWYSRS